MHWTRRTQALTPEQWHMRAQAIAAKLEGLSIAELMRGDKSGHDAQKYAPNQPRVPAGHPDGVTMDTWRRRSR